MALKRLKWLKYLFVGRTEAETEQGYWNEKRKKHLANEHSEGIAVGLEVVETTVPSLSVQIAAGRALDTQGNDPEVESVQEIDLASLVPATGTSLVYITLKYNEVETDPYFVDEIGDYQNKFIQDSYQLEATTSVPSAPAVELARVNLGAGATSITDAADPDNPQTNEIDLRYRATAALPAQDILDALKTVDGAGSGLDADLLDGQHASAFTTVGHTHPGTDITSQVGDADTVDGQHSSEFAPSSKGVTNGDTHSHSAGDGSQIPTGGLADLAVSAGKIQDGAVNGNKIEALAVSNSKIQDGAVNGNKIAALAVSTGKIQDGAVNGNKIQDLAVSGAKISKSPVSDGSQSIAAGATWTPAPGIYNIVHPPLVRLELFITGSGWQYHAVDTAGTVICDGSNMRLGNNDLTNAANVSYQKF